MIRGGRSFWRRASGFYFRKATAAPSAFFSSPSSTKEKFHFAKYATGGSILLVVGGAVAARSVYGSLLGGSDKVDHGNNKGPRKDASKATVLLQHVPTTTASPGGATTEPISPNNLQYNNSNNKNLQQVDAAQFGAFVAEQQAILKQARQSNETNSANVLHNELEEALTECSGRINEFVDWYLAYPTTYKLLSIAVQSALQHAVTIRKEQSLAQAVSEGIQAHVCQKYEAIVLRPALTDPKIHRAFVRSLQQAHHDYWAAVEALEESVGNFVRQHATPYYASAPVGKDVILDLDWAAQLQKVQHIPAAYEKNPEMTVALVTAGAVTGKVAGGAATVGAAKALAAKLAAPFASKAAASAVTGKAAAGGALLGAPLGGAVGAAVGAAIGIGVDMGVNLGVALMQRSDLQRDVQESMRATIQEWEELVLRPELERVQAIWYEHAEGLLQKRHDASKTMGRSTD